MTITEAKKEYNLTLARYYKAVEYFSKINLTQEDKEKYLDSFSNILTHLSNLLTKVGPYKYAEVLGGFYIE